MKFTASPTAGLIASKQQLKEGDVVTFTHRGFWLGNQTPKSPSIYRVRTDVSWSDVVDSFQHSKSLPSPTCSFTFNLCLMTIIIINQ